MITRYLRAALLIALVASAYGQVPSRATVGPHDFAGCKPVSERTGETGCWIIVSEPVGQLPLRPMFWHLDRYLTRSDAEKAKGPRGTVVDSLGKIWLLTIADADWRPGGSEHLAEIGPLPVDPNTSYTTQYMEAIMPPGLQTSTHRHSGPEAWYTESGETCLDSQGRFRGSARWSADAAGRDRHRTAPIPSFGAIRCITSLDGAGPRLDAKRVVPEIAAPMQGFVSVEKSPSLIDADFSEQKAQVCAKAC